MRTTVTLDPDVMALIKAYMKRHDMSFKLAANELLRMGHARSSTGGPDPAKFVVKPFRAKLAPGYDEQRLRQQAESEDDERHALASTGRKRRSA